MLLSYTLAIKLMAAKIYKPLNKVQMDTFFTKNHKLKVYSLQLQ